MPVKTTKYGSKKIALSTKMLKKSMMLVLILMFEFDYLILLVWILMRLRLTVWFSPNFEVLIERSYDHERPIDSFYYNFDPDYHYSYHSDYLTQAHLL